MGTDAAIPGRFQRFAGDPLNGIPLAGLITYLYLLPVFYNQRFMLTLLIWWSAGIGSAAHYLTRSRPGVLTKGLLVVLALAALLGTYRGIQRSQGAAGGN